MGYRSPLKRNIWHSYSSGRGSGIFRGTNRCSDRHYPTSPRGVRHYSPSESAAKTSELADRSEKSIWIRHKHEGKEQAHKYAETFLTPITRILICHLKSSKLYRSNTSRPLVASFFSLRKEREREREFLLRSSFSPLLDIKLFQYNFLSIVTNVTNNFQGLLLNLTPGGMLAETANHVSPDMPEDGSMHESLTMEQFNSPLVSPQYKSTYAIVATSGEFYNAKSFAHSVRTALMKFFSLIPLVIKPSIRLFPFYCLANLKEGRIFPCSFVLSSLIVILRAIEHIFLEGMLVLFIFPLWRFTNFFFYKVFN